MQNDALPLQVIRLASKTFAGEKGFSGPEIMDFFRQYADDIPDYHDLSNVPSRWRLFEDCLERFPATKQRHILLDLCGWEGPMKWGRPDPDAIATLRRLLVEGVPVDEFTRKLREIPTQMVQEEMWDVFISHASEDKEAVARPLAQALSQKGLEVWYDEFTLTLGDSLRRSINAGLVQSRYGVVILSPDFFAKEWPQLELDGLAALELDGEKKILPVWHNVTQQDVARFSPILADRLAVSSQKGIGTVVDKILRVVRPSVEHGAEPPKPIKDIELRTPQLASQEEPALPNDLWRYDFIDHFAEADQRRHQGSDIELHDSAICDNQTMRAIFEHPPDQADRFTTLTYGVMIPSRLSLIELTGFIGIEEARPTPEGLVRSKRSPENAVQFTILIDDKAVFQKRKETRQWERFSILLHGRDDRLKVSFVTNNLGETAFNWAVWGEPQLIQVT